jgi:pyrimidine-nucleoside phosphorylase
LAKLAEVLAARGGDPRQVEQPELLPMAPTCIMLPAPLTGYLARIEDEKLGLVSMHLGVGRFQKGEQINYA